MLRFLAKSLLLDPLSSIVVDQQDPAALIIQGSRDKWVFFMYSNSFFVSFRFFHGSFCFYEFSDGFSEFSELLVGVLILMLVHEDVVIIAVCCEVFFKHLIYCFSEFQHSMDLIAIVEVCDSTRMVIAGANTMVNECVYEAKKALFRNRLKAFVILVQSDIGSNIEVKVKECVIMLSFYICFDARVRILFDEVFKIYKLDLAPAKEL
jgi:hypothetical protein